MVGWGCRPREWSSFVTIIWCFHIVKISLSTWLYIFQILYRCACVMHVQNSATCTVSNFNILRFNFEVWTLNMLNEVNVCKVENIICQLYCSQWLIMNKHHSCIFHKNDPFSFAGRIKRSKSDERGYKQTWKWTWCKLKKKLFSFLSLYNHTYLKMYSMQKIF